jgi:predicted DNA-binding antitoxin AbrB/MazE fold protein
MGGTIPACVKEGVLVPLEETDLPEGKEVIVTVIGVAEGPDDEAFSPLGGKLEGSR